MLKRIGITIVVAAALFGAVSTGMLSRHRELRKVAAELLRMDVDVLVGE